MAIDPTAIIRPWARLGENVTVREYTVIGTQGTIKEDGKHASSLMGVVVGDNVDINSHCAIHRGHLRDTVIGDNVIIGSQCLVGHDAQIASNVIMKPCSSIHGYAELGEDCEIGAKAVVFNRVKVGARALIGGGSVVTEDVPPNVVAYGNPCRVIRQRFGLVAKIQRGLK